MSHYALAPKGVHLSSHEEGEALQVNLPSFTGALHRSVAATLWDTARHWATEAMRALCEGAYTFRTPEDHNVVLVSRVEASTSILENSLYLTGWAFPGSELSFVDLHAVVPVPSMYISLESHLIRKQAEYCFESTVSEKRTH